MLEKQPSAGILLAAGMSRRFGSVKQLARLQGRRLIQIALDAALGSQLARVVLVLGHCGGQVRHTIGMMLGHPRLEVVANPDYPSGLGSSIRTGMQAIGEDYPSVMFLLADQPLVTSSLIDGLLNRFWASDKHICVPVANRRRGNPTLFSRRYYPLLCRLSGDEGGRGIIKGASGDVLWAEMDDGACLMDIDAPSDLDRLAHR